MSLPALRVEQPLGEFFVVSMPAQVLRGITFLDPTRIAKVDRGLLSYWLAGAQRQHSDRRAKQIAKYIDTTEAAFPNSIILAANYIEYGEVQDDETKTWRVEKSTDGFFRLHIPTGDKMASIIDGQHRLLGFDHCKEDRKDMELLCAVYMDLPYAYQAYLFATINMNQRRVDKSLAYEQFGYNLDTESRNGWSPDKVAVYITRKANLDKDSPLYNRVKVAPLNSDLLFPEGEDASSWRVSTACLVEGIAHLISQSPTKDRDVLHKVSVTSRKRTLLGADSSPLRQLYLESKDEEIYELIKTFFKTSENLLWATATPKSFICRTLGVQALLDVLKNRVLREFSGDFSLANLR
jgi:DNA phosphorothioation-associated DGQHR protein 1